VWKRIVVIAAGPAVNIVLAFLILWGLYMANGTIDPPIKVGPTEAGTPAARILHAGDAILAVDGRVPAGGDLKAVSLSIAQRIDASRGAPVTLKVRRAGHTLTVTAKPFYDAKLKRWRLGFGYSGGTHHDAGPVRASGLAAGEMWRVTSGTVSAVSHIFIPQDRKQLSGVVGGYETTRAAFSISASAALEVLALISLSLGVINLFPFLPLDGGHIFWALAEKVRGRAIPFSVMERAGFVGFALVLALFVIGFTNDIGRLTGEGFQVR
jgi:regulator of sigma E protease